MWRGDFTVCVHTWVDAVCVAKDDFLELLRGVLQSKGQEITYMKPGQNLLLGFTLWIAPYFTSIVPQYLGLYLDLVAPDPAMLQKAAVL